MNNKCALVWEGVVKGTQFHNWQMQEIRSETEIRRILADRGVEQYWDLVANYKYPEDEKFALKNLLY